jgi:hypothetical protein
MDTTRWWFADLFGSAGHFCWVGRLIGLLLFFDFLARSAYSALVSFTNSGCCLSGFSLLCSQLLDQIIWDMDRDGIGSAVGLAQGLESGLNRAGPGTALSCNIWEMGQGYWGIGQGHWEMFLFLSKASGSSCPFLIRRTIERPSR